MKPRRQQATISFQSDRAKARLAVLTRTGRSQAEIIEELLERAPDPPPERSEEYLARRRAEIDTLIARVPKGSIMSMKEFDALEYDENGDPR